MNITKAFAKRFILAFITVFMLSGCFLVSETEILKKGQEIRITEGEYLIIPINLDETKKPGMGTKIKNQSSRP